MADTYFDSDRAQVLMVQAKSGVCSVELQRMVMQLYWGLTRHKDFRRYPLEIHQDMVSSALFGFVAYVIKSYRPTVKSTSGAYSYITWCGRTAFQKCLSQHYRHKNLHTALADESVCDRYYSLYSERLVDQDDSMASVLSNYEHETDEETKELPSSDAGGTDTSDWVWDGRCYCYRDPDQDRRS